MPLNIPSYPNPFDAANPLNSAYAWISGVYLDLAGGNGRIVLNVHPSAAAANTSPPLAQVSNTLGQILSPGEPTATPPVAPTYFPDLAELMGDPAFAAAFATIQAKIELAMLQVPALVGSTQIP